MERLRITPSPYHDDGLIDALAKALIDVWDRLALPRKDQAIAQMSNIKKRPESLPGEQEGTDDLSRRDRHGRRAIAGQ
jgi:hypothetical protein